MASHDQGGIVRIGRKKKKTKPSSNPERFSTTKAGKRTHRDEEKRLSQKNVSFGGRPSDAINPRKPKGSGMSFSERVHKLNRALKPK